MTTATTSGRFVPARLRIARNFHRLTQPKLAERTGTCKQFIFRLERGEKSPGEITLQASFFSQPVTEEFTDAQCNFRRPRATPLFLRRQVLAHGSLFAMLIAYLKELLNLPKRDVPAFRIRDAAEIERVAERCRTHWGLGTDRPVKSMTRVLERASVPVANFQGRNDVVDAFSFAGSQYIVALNLDKESASRARMSLAHECGHLVMHEGLVTGEKETERQADQFASAFLMPRSGIARELPRRRVDWDAMFRLKARWGVSIQALVRRAFDARPEPPGGRVGIVGRGPRVAR